MRVPVYGDFAGKQFLANLHFFVGEGLSAVFGAVKGETIPDWTVDLSKIFFGRLHLTVSGRNSLKFFGFFASCDISSRSLALVASGTISQSLFRINA